MTIEIIWQEYRASLERFLSSKVSNAADVDDLLQSILIKTYQNLGSLNSDDSLKPWLFQIANRSIIDFYRKQAKQRALSADDLWYEEAHENENELVKCIEPFIQFLPEKHSQLLTAIELNGQSQKEYAALYNISYSTLKSRVQKARQELKSLFDRCCQLQLDRHGNPIDCDNDSAHCGDC